MRKKKEKTAEMLQELATQKPINEETKAKMIDTSAATEEQCKLLNEECQSLRRQLAGVKGENTKLKATLQEMQKLNAKLRDDLQEMGIALSQIDKQRNEFLAKLKAFNEMPWYKKISYKYRKF